MERHNFALSSEEKADAREALRLLDGSGMSLPTAVKIALAGKRSLRRDTVEDTADAFLKSRIASGCRPSTVTWYDEQLIVIAGGMGGRVMDDVTRSEFRQWLTNTERAASSRAGIARVARALWRWAIAADPPIATHDVTLGLDFAPPGRAGASSPNVLTVAQCAAILRGMQAVHVPAVALMLFAGIRPEEVAGDRKKRLAWSCVNREERIIRVPPEISKTRAPRILEGLPDTLWRWLPAGAVEGTVAKANRPYLVRHCLAASGLRVWPQDGLRHTFASNAIASTNNPGLVSMWLGHAGNPAMLHRHYRGLVTAADAAKFWALAPVVA